MKVIFLQHVVNVWKVWEIKEVNDSYARNFLIPKKYAKQFTKEDEKNLELKKKKIEKNRINKVENRHELWEKLNWKTFTLTLSKGTGKLFWSVTEKEIIEILKKEEKLDFTKWEIVMENWHIKKPWKHDVFVKLWAWEMAKIIINIV